MQSRWATGGERANWKLKVINCNTYRTINDRRFVLNFHMRTLTLNSGVAARRSWARRFPPRSAVRGRKSGGSRRFKIIVRIVSVCTTSGKDINLDIDFVPVNPGPGALYRACLSNAMQAGDVTVVRAERIPSRRNMLC